MDTTLASLLFPKSETVYVVHMPNHTDITPLIRVYYEPRARKGDGFEFVVVERDGYIDSTWRDSDVVEVVCYGFSFFDGLRHLYFGSEQTENEGYLYCPSFRNLTKIFSVLEDLCMQYCSDLEANHTINTLTT